VTAETLTAETTTAETVTAEPMTINRNRGTGNRDGGNRDGGNRDGGNHDSGNCCHDSRNIGLCGAPDTNTGGGWDRNCGETAGWRQGVPGCSRVAHLREVWCIYILDAMHC
jgi:hypothetical protein